MDDPKTKIERLAHDALAQSQARQDARRARAEENRRRFPTAARAMDLFACFHPRILYAREGTDEIGTIPPWRRDDAN
jgi:hypothetical protein